MISKLGIKPTHYTVVEVGKWEPWDLEGFKNHSTAHAIKFEDGSIFDMKNGWRQEPVKDKWETLLAEANARFDALSPQQQEEHRYEQRRSFVRGSCPSNQDFKEWCKMVDRILPPKGSS